MSVEYNLYDVGEHKILRLSKDNCQRFLHALVASRGRVVDSISFSYNGSGVLLEGIKAGSADALFRVSLPAGNEKLFESIFGEGTLEEIPEICLN